MTPTTGGTMATATEHVVTPGEILTYSGLYVTPLDLQPEHVCIEDIAHALSNQCRYSGHTKEFYSVAQHCVLVADYLWLTGETDTVVFSGLMHDAAEAYLQDMPRPLKEDPEFGRLYRKIEAKAEAVISSVLGFTYPYPEAVKYADVVLLASERKAFMPPNGDWNLGDIDEYTVVTPWNPMLAETTFLGLFNHFTNH